jgi:NAD(P)-dependent dehydrogenase (short-subunit alcohol dehydrogenase family)
MTKLEGAVAVVTGAGHGIGRALAKRFSDEGASVAVLDIDGPAAAEVAGSLPRGLAIEVDVTQEADVEKAVQRVVESLGPIDVYCSNAGIAAGSGLGDNDDWARSIAINTMSHVYAARLVLPSMAARSSGHFVVTSSAGGLLMLTKSGHYTATKHAAVALAEWLAVEYGDADVGIHCLVPGAVRTRMATGDPAGFAEATAGRGRFVDPENVAAAVVEAMRAGEFLILSHPDMHRHELNKVTDRTTWISKLRARAARTAGA